MKRILVLLLVNILSVSFVFAYTQTELESKKIKYISLIQKKIWKKIDALSDKMATKILALIDIQVRKTNNSKTLSGSKKLNKLALLLWLKDILDNKISIRFVEKGLTEIWDAVSVDYTLTLEDWSIVDTSIGKVPFTFVIWEWQVIEWWETWLLWRKKWESFKLIVKPEQWYWLYDPNNVSVVTKKSLQSFVDNGVELLVWTNLSTQSWNFPIIAITWDSITIDTNHSLAWKTLYFDIEIKRINKIENK